jgi:hypothetical protein
VQALDDPKMQVLFDDRLMALSMIDAPQARHVCDAPLVNSPYDRHLPAHAAPFQKNGLVLAREALLVFDEGVEAKGLLTALLVMEAVVCTRPVEAATHGRSRILPRHSRP